MVCVEVITPDGDRHGQVSISRAASVSPREYLSFVSHLLGTDPNLYSQKPHSVVHPSAHVTYNIFRDFDFCSKSLQTRPKRLLNTSSFGL